MRIGELADVTGVSRRLLRYYEEQGLLTPVRDANGYREYSESDVATVRHIRALLATGLPTAVIARLLDCFHDDVDERIVPSACPAMISNLQEQQARIDDAISRLRESQKALGSMLDIALGAPERVLAEHQQ